MSSKWGGSTLYDVVVVGAGPAGAYAASKCASSGLKTILLERSTLPRDKLCGGATDESILDRIGKDVEPLVKARTTGARLLFDFEEVAVLNHSHLYFERAELDERIARLAQESGAILQEDTRVDEVTIGRDMARVVSNKGEFRGKLVIGADGVNSTVRRYSGLDRYREEPDRILCCALEGRASREVMDRFCRSGPSDFSYETYFFHGFAGFGWLFPKNNKINIGAGQVIGDSRTLRNTFASIAARLGWGRSAAERAGYHMIPYRPLKRIFTSRVMLVGDAAGFVNPLTGSGIDLGLASAENAAEVALDACAMNDFSESMLLRYQARCGPVLKSLRMKSKILDLMKFLVDRQLDPASGDRFVLRHLSKLAG